MVNSVKNAVQSIVTEMGYEIVDVTFEKQFGNDTLTIYIYKKGGVSHDDCILVNDAVSPILDELDPTVGKQYHLNISSPGLDRPIVTEDDFRRSVGEDVEVVLKKATDDGKKKTHGILTAYTDTCVTLDTEKGSIQLARENIKKLQLYIKF